MQQAGAKSNDAVNSGDFDRHFLDNGLYCGRCRVCREWCSKWNDLMAVEATSWKSDDSDVQYHYGGSEDGASHRGWSEAACGSVSAGTNHGNSYASNLENRYRPGVVTDLFEPY